VFVICLLYCYQLWWIKMYKIRLISNSIAHAIRCMSERTQWLSSFWPQRENRNEDRPTLSAVEITAYVCTFCAFLWWWHTVKNTRNLHKSTCTRNLTVWHGFLYKIFLAPNTAQLCSIQETCMHVTRMVSSDWSPAYRCHVFILWCWCCWQFVVQS